MTDTARSAAIEAIASFLAEGPLSGQVDERYWHDQAAPYLDAIEDVGLTVVWAGAEGSTT